jgi:Flp pilus assembly protein TadD
LAELERATRLEPAVARFAYAYALALNGAGRADDAIRVLTSTLAAHPDDREVLVALAAFERDAGRLAAAREHAALLLARNPDDREARALADSLRPRGK